MKTIHEASSYSEGRSALFTEGDARAELGGISRATLLRLRQRGELAFVRVGRRVFFRPRDLEDYIERNREAGP